MASEAKPEMCQGCLEKPADPREFCQDREEDCARLRAEVERLKQQHVKSEQERGLLYDALRLHMQSTGITAEAMDKVDELRLVMRDASERVATECERLESGWRVASAERDSARANVRLYLDECAQCGGALHRPDQPPHCYDCVVDEDHLEAWESARALSNARKVTKP
jgi:hypothetical protein